MRAAIYCRVSTDDQEKEGTSLQTQIDACLAYCKQKGYEVARQFRETYSGLTLERPKLVEIRQLVKAYQLDVVVVYCLDRLSRDPYHGVILTQELENHHARLEAVTETVESSEMGKLINYIRGFASKLEAEKIFERTMRGKQARLKEGKLPQGTGIGIFGYSWDKATGKRIINEPQAKVVLQIFTMALRGDSVNKIATILNKAGVRTMTGSPWHPLTIKRFLTNETYTGKTYFGKTSRTGSKTIIKPREQWVLLPDVTPLIITEEMFKRTQEFLLETKQSRPIKQNSPYLLTGFMKCSKCGSPIGGTTLNGKYRYYQCRGAKPTATRGKICDAGYIRADELEKSIWNKIVELTTSPLSRLSLLTDITKKHLPHVNDVLSLMNRQVNQLRKKVKTYPARERNLYDLLSHGNVTKEYVLDAIDNLKRERLNDEHQLESLLTSRKETAKADYLNLKLSEYSENLRLGLTLPADFREHTVRLRDILKQLHLKIQASPKSYNFTIVFYGQIISTEDSEIDATFAQRVKEFEQLHPDITIFDLINPYKRLPEDTLLGKTANQLKQNLVTIEQTSASPRERNYRCRPA